MLSDSADTTVVSIEVSNMNSERLGVLRRTLSEITSAMLRPGETARFDPVPPPYEPLELGRFDLVTIPAPVPRRYQGRGGFLLWHPDAAEAVRAAATAECRYCHAGCAAPGMHRLGDFCQSGCCPACSGGHPLVEIEQYGTAALTEPTEILGADDDTPETGAFVVLGPDSWSVYRTNMIDARDVPDFAAPGMIAAVILR